MNSGSQEVKMKVDGVNKVVGTASYPIYDAVAEAVSHVGEEKVLELLNAQTRTNEMNRVRGLARGGPSKKALESKAIARITPGEWQQIAGDGVAITAKIEEKIALIKAEQAAANGGATEDDGDED
jgi:hypothetical protein